MTSTPATDAPCLRTSVHQRTGAAIVVLCGIPNVAVGDAARKLGARYGKRSGRKADGGPGHHVAGYYYWPRKLYDASELLRARIEALLASNTSDFERSVAARARVRELEQRGAR